jgi:preprotein translocase subunit SecG
VSILKGLFEVDDPLGLSFDQNVSLGLDVLDLVLLVHLVLLHFLHGHHLARLSVSADAHFAKSTSANYVQRIKIFYSHFFAPKM